MRRRIACAAAALAAAVAGCAKTPAPPPVTSLDGRSCAAAPELDGARPLSLEEGDKETVELGPSAPCWQADSRSLSTYAVFRLPTAEQSYVITVRSAPVGEALFAARLALLDEKGAITRELGCDTFHFQGPILYQAIRSRPAERYLVVASDPSVVGKQVSQVIGSVSTQMVTTGTAFFSVYTGREDTSVHTFAHNGSLTVSAEPIPKVD
jgi:hypothetical protein